MEPVKRVKPVIQISKGRSGLGLARMEWTQERLLQQLEEWRRYLQEPDRSAGTVEKYLEAVLRFLAWYEQEEGAPLQLEALTPIALIGYRNHLQHEQQKSISTINLRIRRPMRIRNQIGRSCRTFYLPMRMLIASADMTIECPRTQLFPA